MVFQDREVGSSARGPDHCRKWEFAVDDASVGVLCRVRRKGRCGEFVRDAETGTK